ncbi:Nonribosomal peptide synthetase 7 [Penicillium hordei]|uniref:Nonribosomal peptide synthetase 7 n=1 Tax=Penicillium hordei TaxID=40994 RepID=A0AAD6DNC3_9EURO|nr:Nonribosomal peptide synthetase 7 [Penicillium hordei]KAJ5589593.1 Nonribosomal peptide synthetase 7 [Penicillium hordei]
MARVLGNTTTTVRAADAAPSKLLDSFPMDYLASVGASAMGLSRRLAYYVASKNEILAKPRLRIPTAVRCVVVVEMATPQVMCIHCTKAQSSVDAANVIISSEGVTVLMDIRGMAFAGIGGESLLRKSTSGLVHQFNWPPAALFEPLEFAHITSLAPNPTNTKHASDLPLTTHLSLAAVYLHQVTDQIFSTAASTCNGLLSAVQVIISFSNPHTVCLSVLTSKTNLAHSALTGLGQIVRTEHPEIWGSLIDLEDP